MYTPVDNMENLLDLVHKDKASEGSGALTANRYPVRFVLFDNFRDCYQFVNRMQDTSAKVIRISQWMDKDWPDVMIGFSKLAQNVENIINKTTKDVVIAPFSELARFYGNKERTEFNSLISTIKSTENDQDAFNFHRRVYIPLVGLEGKMSHFYNDSQSIMWYLKSNVPQQSYKLVLTQGTDFGVNGIKGKYTTANTVLEWLNIWTEQELTQTIICTSPSIYANADNADPDNAFEFAICDNAHKFLTEGLRVNLKFLDYRKEEEEYWSQLAQKIDVKDFQFEKFFNSKFDIHELANYSVFLKKWFEFKNQYDRWLLAAYYKYKFCNSGYICRALNECNGYTNVDFVEALATTIFDLDDKENHIEERAEALKEAAANDIVISAERENLLKQKLEAMAEDPKMGYDYALSFFTPLTDAEKSLVIEWLGNDKITLDRLKDIYPDLYLYMSALNCDVEQEWVHKYVDEYRRAKVANKYSDAISNLIDEHNGSEVAFNKWYQSFSTTHTQLDGRDDIEVYYWIDGLGIDWIPFVANIVESHKDDKYFLNETIIAKAQLPTKTSVNKESLLKMAKNDLPKVGDIDEQAHKTRPYPNYIIEDFSIVRSAIEKVLADNPGRKIAIVSDHGISYLSQLCQGLNLSGVTSDHGGRLAVKKSGIATADSKYIVLDDKKTLCALRHESLCAKIGDGSGCHGGCTPEEVFVPIFIISNQPTVKTWTAVLEDLEVSTASPIVHFSIKGLKEGYKPIVIYNGQQYSLKNTAGYKYETPTIPFVADVETIVVKVGNVSESHNIKIKWGAEEEDPFAF